MKLPATACVLLLVLGSADALNCTCSLCPDNYCTGDICSATVVYNVLQGEEQFVTECQSSDYTQCNSSSPIHNTLCCNHGNNCNDHLQPRLGQPTEDPTTDPSDPGDDTGSAATLPPPLDPGDKCFRSDSSEGGLVTLCPLETSCFSTLRRLNDGSIESRRGCSQGPCLEETRGRKVKRCCSEHMCNVLLNVTEFFPDITSSPEPSTSLPATSTQAATGAESEAPPSFIPPILTPIAATTVPPDDPSTADPLTVHCHCRSGDNCVANMACTAQYACSVQFTIVDYTIVSTERGCVDTPQSCDIVRPGQDLVPGQSTYTSCCRSQLCNQNADSALVPAHLLTRPTEPSSVQPPADLELGYKIGAVAIGGVGLLAIVLAVGVVSAIVLVRRRRVKEFSPAHQERAASVQSTASSNGKGSNAQLMTKV